MSSLSKGLLTVVGLLFALGMIGMMFDTDKAEPPRAAAVDSAVPRGIPNQSAADREATEVAGAAKNFETALPRLTEGIKNVGGLAKTDVQQAQRSVDAVQREVALLLKGDLAKDPRVLRLKSDADRAVKAVEQARTAFLAYENGSAEADVEVVSSSWKKGGFDHVGLWTVRLRNTSKVAEYYDLSYKTAYHAPSGTRVTTNSGRIMDRLRPGQTKTFEINDGFINSQASRAGFEIVTGKKARPTQR